MSFSLSNRMVKLIAELERFRGSWQSFGGLALARLEAIEEQAQQQVVGSLCGKEEHGVLLADLTDNQATLFPAEKTLRQWYTELTGEKPSLSDEASRELSGLLEWTRSSLEEGELHPLIVAALFYLRFEPLSPFPKQNECIRTLTVRLILLKSGFQFSRYLVLEPLLQELCLEGSGEETKELLFVELFLGVLSETKRALEGKLLFQCQLLDLHEEEEHIVSLAFERPRLSISELEEETSLGRNRLKQRLRALVKEGHLEQHGRGKATWYSNAFSIER